MRLLIYENHIKKYMIKTILFNRCFKYQQIQTQRLSIHLLTSVTYVQYSWTSYCSHNSYRRIHLYPSLLGITLFSVGLIFLFSHFDTVRDYNSQLSSHTILSCKRNLKSKYYDPLSPVFVEKRSSLKCGAGLLQLWYLQQLSRTQTTLDWEASN